MRGARCLPSAWSTRKKKQKYKKNYCNGEDVEIAVYLLVMSFHHDCCVRAKVKKKGIHEKKKKGYDNVFVAL